MKNKSLINCFLTVSFVGAILISSCKDTGPGLTDIPTSNVSYSQHIQPVLTIYCTRSGCHDDQSMAGGVSFTSWGNTTANPSIVFPRSPQTSKLVWVITGQLPSHPFFSPTPNANQVNGIKVWIQEGAKNN